MSVQILTIEDQERLQAVDHEQREARVVLLRARFDGAIRYYPLLEQHPDWSDEEIIAFARKWHAKAVEQFKARGEDGWNLGIPYCRNDHRKANLGRS